MSDVSPDTARETPTEPHSTRPPRRAIRLWNRPERPGARRLRWVLYAVGGAIGATVMLNPVLGAAFLLLATAFACFFFLLESSRASLRRLRPGGRLPFLLRRWSVVRRPGELICPFCHDQLPGLEAVMCDGCDVAYHPECREELLGGCGTLGCVHQGRVVRQAPKKVSG